MKYTFFRTLVFVCVLVTSVACSPATPSFRTPEIAGPTDLEVEVEAEPVFEGYWVGTLEELIGDMRVLGATFDILPQPGGAVSGKFILTFPEGPPEEHAVNGTIQGNKIQFTEPDGRYFWATLDGDELTGFVSWECYDCGYWGTFTLTRQSGTTDLPPPDQSLPAPIRFVDVADGGTVTASVDPVTGLPTATIRIGIDADLPAPYIGLDANGLIVGRFTNDPYQPAPFEKELKWTPWEGNGAYTLSLQVLDWDNTSQVLSTVTISVNVTGIPEGTPTVRERFIELYRQNFGLNLTAPAFARNIKVFSDSATPSVWVSTAYIEGKLYEIMILDDGTVNTSTRPVGTSAPDSVCRPAGYINMLAVIVDYGNTGMTPSQIEADLYRAQQAANERWAKYSSSLSLSQPILHLGLTVAIAGTPITPGQFLSPGQILSGTGQDAAQFDIVAQVDMDADNTTMGQYGGLGISLGGCNPSGATSVNLGITARDSQMLAIGDIGGSLIEHELTHSMGWLHHWPNGFGSGEDWLRNRDGWEPYLLFGWTDTDGDGVIEIYDQTPYGLTP